MVNPLRPPKSPLDDRNAEVIVEAREVRATARVIHLGLERVRYDLRFAAPRIVHALACSRSPNEPRDLAKHRTQRRRSRRTERWPKCDHVLIEIGDTMLGQYLSILLDIFG